MTKSERIRAFELRLEGSGWEQIGREIGYTGETVKQDLRRCIQHTPR